MAYLWLNIWCEICKICKTTTTAKTELAHHSFSPWCKPKHHYNCSYWVSNCILCLHFDVTHVQNLLGIDETQLLLHLCFLAFLGRVTPKLFLQSGGPENLFVWANCLCYYISIILYTIMFSMLCSRCWERIECVGLEESSLWDQKTCLCYPVLCVISICVSCTQMYRCGFMYICNTFCCVPLIFRKPSLLLTPWSVNMMVGTGGQAHEWTKTQTPSNPDINPTFLVNDILPFSVYIYIILWLLHVCVCVCVCACVCVRLCVYVWQCVTEWMCVTEWVSVWLPVCVCVCVYLCVYVCQGVSVCVCVRMCVSEYVCVFTHFCKLPGLLQSMFCPTGTRGRNKK